MLHRVLQRERAVERDQAADSASRAGEAHSKWDSDSRIRMLVERVRDYAIFMIEPHAKFIGRHIGGVATGVELWIPGGMAGASNAWLNDP
ncbi:MAG TPA: hypothetical protein VFM14_15950 [Gemmatimonadales bacterium]|nr:hypothetical protein [Gemmatimonadales bacterium]